MARIALLGASGFVGSLVAGALAAEQTPFVAVGRSRDRLETAVRAAGATDVSIRVADADDAASLRSVLQGVELAISAIGPFDRTGRAVVDAAIAAGVHLVDLAAEQPYLRWAVEERDDDARRAGVTVVPGAGFFGLPGDLLANIAAGAVRTPREVHVAYILPDRRMLGATSAGTRRTLATLLGEEGVAFDRGGPVSDLPGEARRLAWFPRPIGPAHAAGIPGGEPITVPRHIPGVRTVRTYLALPSWRAELLQMVANAARYEPVRRRLVRRLDRRSGDPSEVRRTAIRWGCVAEVQGDDGVARAWAYGHDPYRLAAAAAVATAAAVLTGRADAGVLPPALAEGPSELLDELSVRTDLRWSIVRPEPR